MALKLLHNEQVREGGNKAQWPFESSYTDPVRTGYLFEGWKYKNRVYTPQEYSSQSNNPFGPITNDENYIRKINFKLLDSDGVKSKTFELDFTEVEDTIFEGKTFVPRIMITINQ